MASVETVTVLFTDLVGSTELSSGVSPERADELRVEHFQLLRRAIAASGGHEVKNLGDGLMVVFSSAASAIECAASIQERVESRNRAADEPFGIRIGLAMGDATVSDGDYFGAPVIEAARLCAKAAGGQVLLTDLTRVMAGRRGGHRFVPVGLLELKGLPEAVMVSELAWRDEPEEEAPPAQLAQEAMPPVTSEPSQAVLVSSQRFVGRERELAMLEGDFRAMVIAGDAGVGKSRLVGELERRARAEGKLVLVGECLELTDGELPYAPIVAALRRVLPDIEPVRILTPAERAVLARLWPELAPTAADAASENDRESQARVFGLLLELLSRLARQRPVLFIIEDLHWADHSTRDFLAFLLRSLHGERLSVVMTVRAEELHREHPLRGFVAELGRIRGVRRLELAPFTREELALQVEGIIGQAPPRELVDRLFERAEGNAFYTEELLAAGETTGLPESLRDLLLIRIERLSEPARRVLAVAAAAGRAVDERLLAAVNGIPRSEFAAGLREALAHQVLVPRGDEGTYAFRHALAREALYRDLLATERMQLHEAIAQALAQKPELAATRIGVAAELAYHWHAAGEYARALQACVQASVDAMRAYAFAEALNHCERALELWERVDDPAEVAGQDRAAILIRGSRAGIHADETERAGELAREAIAELQDSEPERAARAYMLLGRAKWLSGRNPEALEAYQAAVRLVPAEPPTPERALVLAAEGQALMLSGMSKDAKVRCDEALELARALGDRFVEAHVRNTLTGLAAGDPVEHATIARRIAIEVGAPEELGRSYANGSEALDSLGRTEDAIALAQEGIAAAPRWGMRDFVLYLTASVAGWQFRLGRWSEAERLCYEIAPRDRTASVPRHTILGQLAMMRGDFTRADDELTRAAEFARGIGGPEWWPASLAALATLRLWQGQLDDARRIIEQALNVVDNLEFGPWLGDFADVYPVAARVFADGSPDDASPAAGAVERFEAMFATIPRNRELPRPMACLALARAEASRAARRPDPDAWLQAAERFEALGEPYTRAYAQFRQGEALLAAGGDAEQAAGLLNRARETMVALGELPLRARIEALAQERQLVIG